MTKPDLRIFLDRSVGTKKIAAALRELNLDVETIQDRYGAASPTTADEQWIAEATAAGRILIGADQRIRYRPLERRTICRAGARCFTFPSGSMKGDEMVARLIQHLDAMSAAAAEAGPYVYHLAPAVLQRMKLDCADASVEAGMPGALLRPQPQREPAEEESTSALCRIPAQLRKPGTDGG